jgi:hypothetical protein
VVSSISVHDASVSHLFPGLSLQVTQLTPDMISIPVHGYDEELSLIHTVGLVETDNDF